LSYTLSNLLAGVYTEDRILFGTVHPNVTLGEFDLEQEASQHFFGVAPQDSAEQSRQLEAALEKAAQLGIEILVLPELCLDPDLQESLSSSLARFPSLKVVVVGSVHTVADGVRRNRSRILVGGRGNAIVDKHYPAEIGRRIERIVGATEFTVWTSPFVSLAVLICRDALAPDLNNLVQRLGVNLLLIPAMTPQIGGFLGILNSVSCENQGFAVLANNPADWAAVGEEASVPLAVFATPIETHSPDIVHPDEQGVCLISMSTSDLIPHAHWISDGT
jgi:hypothetical protein